MPRQPEFLAIKVVGLSGIAPADIQAEAITLAQYQVTSSEFLLVPVLFG